MGFRIQGLGLRDSGLGDLVSGFGCRALVRSFVTVDPSLRVLGLRAQGLGVWGLGSRAWSFGLRGVSKAHSLVYHSTIGLTVIKKKKWRGATSWLRARASRATLLAPRACSTTPCAQTQYC